LRGEVEIRDGHWIRNSIIKISYHTHKMMEDLAKKAKLAEKTEERRRIDEERKYVDWMNYLKTMEIDSLKWPEYDDLKLNVLISPTILH